MKKWLLSISLVGAGLLLMLCQSKQKTSTSAAVATPAEKNPAAPVSETTTTESVGGKAVIHGTQDQEKLDSIKRVKNSQKRP